MQHPAKRYRIYGLTLLLLVLQYCRAQQQPMFSQYMFNMLNINPAFAGGREVGSATLLLRNQWLGFDGAPVTGAFSYDGLLRNRNVGLGVQVYFDQIGIEKTTGFQGFYSYKIPFNESTLSLGLSFGALNYRANLAAANGFQPDPLTQSVINSILPTAGFGAFYAKRNWYIGLSSPALFKTKGSLQKGNDFKVAGAEGNYFLTAGALIEVNPDVELKPSFLLRATGGAPLQADINLMAWMNDVFGAGFSYRHKSAIVGLMEFQVSPQLRIGYSFDYNIKNFIPYNKGTHELMFRFEFGSDEGFGFSAPRMY